MREVTIAYGMTETSPVSFQSSVDDPLERRVSTVGKVQPHIEVKIIDEAGQTVPRGRFGEEICAWLQLRPGAVATPEEMREFCKGEIAHYKIPRYIVFVDEFPMTVTGKIQKFVMRDSMILRLGLSQDGTA